MKYITHISDVLISQLKELHGAEKQQAKSWPRLIARAGNYQMEKILEMYFSETRMRIYRIEEVFYLLDQYPKSKECQLVSEILERMNKICMQRTDKSIIDSDLLLSLQSINYLVIARYASVSAYAKAMDKENVTQILNESIIAAKDIDKQITCMMIEQVQKKNIVKKAILS